MNRVPTEMILAPWNVGNQLREGDVVGVLDMPGRPLLRATVLRIEAWDGYAANAHVIVDGATRADSIPTFRVYAVRPEVLARESSRAILTRAPWAPLEPAIGG